MIWLLGASGYIGTAFQSELSARHHRYHCINRHIYTRFDSFLNCLRATKPDFVINCAGYIGKPNVDACEPKKAETILGNTVLPVSIANACHAAGVPLGQVSSGCVYQGSNNYSETDPPNFDFRTKSSFYSGCKALAEEAISGMDNIYIWRLRLPFDEFDNPRNYITKLLTYEKLYDAENTLSHRGDFVKACLDLMESKAPYGCYNVCNPGAVTTRQVVKLIQDVLGVDREFKWFADDAEFYRYAIAPRSNCTLSVEKMLLAGVKIRNVKDAIVSSLMQYKTA